MNAPAVTDRMRCAGFESAAWQDLGDAVLAAGGAWPYGCRESAECVEAIFIAMFKEMLREYDERVGGILPLNGGQP